MIGYLIAFALGAVFGTGLIIGGCWALFKVVARKWGGAT